MQFIPPFNFSIVEDGVYRGAYPTIKNFLYLKRLNIKTIISIIPELPTYDLLEFCNLENIENKHFNVEKYVESVTINISQVSKILKMLTNPINFPIYIHCINGSNNTGYIIMILRKLQNFSSSYIYSEFSRFAIDNLVTSDDVAFLENFKEEVKLTLPLPIWLWGGEKFKHPTLKVYFKEKEVKDEEEVKVKVDKEVIKSENKKLPWEEPARKSILYFDMIFPLSLSLPPPKQSTVSKNVEALFL